LGYEVRDSFEFYGDVFPFSSPPVIDTSPFPTAPNMYITDATLREGQQGWRTLAVEESLKVYEIIHKIDAGKGVILASELFPYTDKDRILIREVLNANYDYPKPIGWIRSRKEDVDLILQTPLRATVMLCSISDYHICYKLGTTRRRAIEKYLETIEYALTKGISLKVSLEDITRADIEGVVIPFVNRVLELGEGYPHSIQIRIADTLGLGLPFSEASLPRGIPAIVRKLKEKTRLASESLEFHGHNDFHLVLANHMAAWLHGAALSNCTLFGVGERTGNCPMEAMLMAYAEMKGNMSDIDLSTLTEAAKLFRDLGLKIPTQYPFFGENAFMTKAGIHIDGLLKNPKIYMPFDPERVLGISPKVAIDSHSGKASVVYWICNTFGVDKNHLKEDKRVEEIYSEIVTIYGNGRTSPLDDREMLALVLKHMPELVAREK